MLGFPDDPVTVRDRFPVEFYGSSDCVECFLLILCPVIPEQEEVDPVFLERPGHESGDSPVELDPTVCHVPDKISRTGGSCQGRGKKGGDPDGVSPLIKIGKESPFCQISGSPLSVLHTHRISHSCDTVL